MSESEEMPEKKPEADASGTVGPEEEEFEAAPMEWVTPAAAVSWRDRLLWAGVLVLLAAVAYSPALQGSFIWDDDHYVYQNTAVTEGSLDTIWTDWNSNPKERVCPQYYPMVFTTFWIEARLWGTDEQTGRPRPLGFHLTNILLHAGNAVLVWVILRRLRVPGSWVAAAVFAVHPLNAESVAWVSERKNVLSGLFALLSLLAYLHFAGVGRDWKEAGDGGQESSLDLPARKWGLYAASLAAFLLAMFSKSVVATLPAVIVVILWWKCRRFPWRDVACLLPFVLIAIVLGTVTANIEHAHIADVLARQPAGEPKQDWGLSWGERVLVAGRAVWFYVAKVLLPVNLTFIYPRWRPWEWGGAAWLWPIGVAAVAVLLWAARRAIGRGPLAAWLIFVGVLTPALGVTEFFPQRYSFVADHFAYLASIALITLVVAAVAHAVSVWWPEPAPAAAPAPVVEAEAPLASPASSRAQAMFWVVGAVLVVLLVGSFVHARVFDNPVVLWQDTLAKNPSSWMAHNNLGYQLGMVRAREERQAGDAPAAKASLEEAAAHFEETTRLRPNHEFAYLNWGNVLMQLGRVKEAMAKFEKAMELTPKSPDVHLQYGLALKAMGLMAAREHAATQAATTQAATTQAAVTQAAAAHLPATTETLPSTAPVASTRGAATTRVAATRPATRAWGEAERPWMEAAEKQFREAIDLAPQFSQAHYQLALLMLAQNRTAEAEAELETAWRARPKDDYADAHWELGMLLARQGRVPAAIFHLARVSEIQPENGEVHTQLGYLLGQVNHIRESIDQFRTALMINPNDKLAYDGLNRIVQELEATTRRAASQAATSEAATGKVTTGAATTRSSRVLPAGASPFQTTQSAGPRGATTRPASGSVR